MTNEEKFLYDLISGIVDDKQGVRIERRVDDMGVLLTLSVSKPDMGRVIGKAGTTAAAIRQILHVFGMKENARINLKIVD